MTSKAAEGTTRAVWFLAFGQTFGWASLYYIYGALLVWVETDTGWSRTSLSFGLSLALIVSALCVPFVGRMVDRGYGTAVLTGGACIGGLALLALSQATTLSGWYITWAVIGVAMSASFYDMCFANLTHRLGPDARRAITHVTLVAGFASTLAFPLGAALASGFGWRSAVIAFAILQLGVTVPLNLFGGRRLEQVTPLHAKTKDSSGGAIGRAMRTSSFWLLAGTFGFGILNHAMLVTYFIPVFTDLGASGAAAVAAASIVGPFQVIGRVFLMMRGQRAGALYLTRGAGIGLVLASIILLMSGVEPLLIFVFAAVQGASNGMLSILRPVLIGDVLGLGDFGAISGAIATVPLLATAIAPVIGALLLQSGGVPALLVACLTCALIATGLALKLRSAHVAG